MHQIQAPTNMVTLRQMRAFVAVAHSASFTRAAQSLHLSQSAVSLLVRELETQLDQRLFERGRRLVLTEAGTSFLRAASRLLDDLDMALANTREMRAGAHRVLRVAVGHLLASTLVPEVLGALARDEPELRIQIIDCPVEQVAARVLAGEADAGIASVDANLRQPDLRLELLFRDSVHLASLHTLPALGSSGGAGSVPWRALLGEPLIQVNPANGLWRDVHARLASQDLRLSYAHEVAMYSTGLALARQGLGRLLLPGFSARSLQLRDLRVQPLVRPVIRWDVSVLQRRGAPVPPALQLLLDRLRARGAW